MIYESRGPRGLPDDLREELVKSFVTACKDFGMQRRLLLQDNTDIFDRHTCPECGSYLQV